MQRKVHEEVAAQLKDEEHRLASKEAAAVAKAQRSMQAQQRKMAMQVRQL